MNTTAAALQANVTTNTIRTWARRGVIAATKTAGRWIIDTASLARRITIGNRRSRKQATMLDLAASITLPAANQYEGPQTYTPTIKERTNRRTNAHMTTVTNWFPLVADKLNSITDEGARIHAMNILATTSIVICDAPDDDWAGDPQAREDGQLRTSYTGNVPQVTVADVLDLAAQIRTQLAK
ncbi:helix-turn-helix domain-containing protein [Streptomyces anulatus]|uniref:hypothetical protein n=1 Tax=Streptomyces anulatus TaxID=1892 RepID=UPI00225ABD22|nr:hypothetical protein [Streptomyces anulatus]MCX4605447.1 helix-turn-helix domain-containing protein [Streptomyces anulatus]